MIATAAPHRAGAFLRWLHGDQAGYIELVAGETDPADPSKIRLLMPTRDRPDALNTRKWFYLDPERPDLYDAAAAYAAQLTDRHGNVYTGIRTYRTKQRSETNTNPGRVIFIDDAPEAPPLPYSASIQTSEHSRHGYYKCNQNVTKDDACRAAAALGGDPSGVDLTQLVRIPDTFNTKHDQRWRVTSQSDKRRIYTLDQIRAMFPAVAPARSARGEITPIHRPELEKHLTNIGELLESGRAKAIKPETQTGRILAGERVAIASAKYRRMDDSASSQIAILAYGFYCRGFLDDEIGAVCLHFYQQWGVEARKGTAWCIADIEQCIALAKAKKPGVVQSPTRYKKDVAPAPIVDQPAKSRARHDRPTRYDAPMLLSRYQQQPELCELRRKARAARLEISTATLDRLELELRSGDNPKIRIEAQPGLPGRVILLGIINIPQPGVLSAPIAESAESSAPIAQNDDRSPQCIGETHPPPEAPLPPAAPLRLADAVRAAFDRVRVDPETGAKRNVTRRRIYIALGPLARSDAAIDRAIADERQRRKFADIVASMQGMKPAILRAQIRLMERLADKSRDQGTNLHKYADWAAREMRGELASRQPEPGRKPRTNCEVLPDPRAARQHYEAELFDLVGQARATMPAPVAVAVKPSGGVARGVCSPNPPPAAAGPPEDALGLIHRLKQQRDQRQGAAP